MKLALVSLLVWVSAAPAAAEPRHAAYLELLGKGGFWGAGIERSHGRLGIGAAASATWLRGERVLSASPYLAVAIGRRGRHGWFAHAGPQLVHQAIRSPVPEWDGRSRLGVAAQVTSGWQLEGRLLVRASLSIVAGPGGVVPWAGVAGGVRW